MDIEAERAEVAANYLSTLNDLTCNSKLTINVLTMLAEESKDYGQVIVDTIKQQISKVEPDLKLPLLYLIDSILKNVGDKGGCAYKKLFSHSIIHIFTGVFEEVGGEIRKRMLLLRRTWNPVFSSTKLYELDVCLNQIDPKWPIVKPKAALPIYDRPKYISLTPEQQQAEIEIKQKELLELKNLKLAIRSNKQIEAELPVQSNMLPPHQTNIGNQTVAPPQQRIAPVNAAVQIQAHHSQSVNPISAQQQPNTNEPSSANILIGHVGGSGFSNSTNHGQRSTSDSTSGNDSMSNTSKSTHSSSTAYKGSTKSNNKASLSHLSKRSSSKGRSSRSSTSLQKKPKYRRDDKLPLVGDDDPKDIDLRTELVPGNTTNSSTTVTNDGKKRSPDDADVDAPIQKKTKSEKIDILFGTEDVDLRVPPMSQIKAESDSDSRGSLKRSSNSLSNDGVNEIFSSDSGGEAIKQSFRVSPKRRQGDKGNSNAVVINNITHKKSPIKENPIAGPKRRRVRKTKWNSRWEPPLPMQALPTNIIPNMSFPAIVPPTQPHTLPLNSSTYSNDSDTLRQFSSSTAPTYAWQQNGKPNVAPSNSSNGTASIINISELYQKLLATGILNNVKEKPKEKTTLIALNKPETLKKRHVSVVASLYSGRQCGSCGLRFPHEQTIKYSQHLDWHYRQNRRDRDSARHAHSRKWYYGMSDWIQYEEIENVDEREKNFFEAQQNEDNSEREDSNQPTITTAQPSCIAGPDDHNRACEMCHDAFETFFHEDTEDWHLRNAVRAEDTIFHPDCYNDYKASLRTTDVTMNLSMDDVSADDNAVDMAVNINGGTTTSFDFVSGEKKLPSFDDGDDDVIIVLEESIVTEIADDAQSQREQTPSTDPNETAVPKIQVNMEDKSSQIFRNNAGSNENLNESDVQILEPNISVLNLDDYVEKELIELASVPPIKIKEEPKYEGYVDYEEDAFEDVGTIEAIDLLDDGSCEHVPATIAISQPNTILSICGNVELQDLQPTTIATNKIKINISKNVHDKILINCSETADPKGVIDTQALPVLGNECVLNATTNDTNGSSKYSGNYIAIATDGSNIIATAAKDNIGDIASAKDTEIEFVVKESIRHVQFNRQPTVRSCVETSGLCSIM